MHSVSWLNCILVLQHWARSYMEVLCSIIDFDMPLMTPLWYSEGEISLDNCLSVVRIHRARQILCLLKIQVEALKKSGRVFGVVVEA